MSVLLDANALMAPVETGVRLFEELERLEADGDIAVPAAVVAELERLAAGEGQEATAAAVGRDLVERCRVVDHEATSGDAAVRELAPAFTYVVTNDAALRDQLTARGVRVIGVRGRTKLAVYERTDA